MTHPSWLHWLFSLSELFCLIQITVLPSSYVLRFPWFSALSIFYIQNDSDFLKFFMNGWIMWKKNFPTFHMGRRIAISKNFSERINWVFWLILSCPNCSNKTSHPPGFTSTTTKKLIPFCLTIASLRQFGPVSNLDHIPDSDQRHSDQKTNSAQILWVIILFIHSKNKHRSACHRTKCLFLPWKFERTSIKTNLVYAA